MKFTSKVLKIISRFFLIVSFLAFVLTAALFIMSRSGTEVYIDGVFLWAAAPVFILVCGAAAILHAVFCLLSRSPTIRRCLLLILPVLILSAAVYFFAIVIAFGIEDVRVIDTMEAPDGTHTVLAVKRMWLIVEDDDFYEKKGIFLKEMATDSPSLQGYHPDFYLIEWTEEGFTLISSDRTYTAVYTYK